MYVASGAWYTYQVCSNDDIGLLLDFLWQIDFALVTTEDYGMKAILGPLAKKKLQQFRPRKIYGRHAEIL